MRDRYNLNLLPGMSEDGVEYGKLQGTNFARTFELQLFSS